MGLPTTAYVEEDLPRTQVGLPLTDPAGNPLTDPDGNPLTSPGSVGTAWTDE